MKTSTILQLEGIQKKFAERVVLNGLNLEIKTGEFVCLLGPSGCGKSTLLRIMAGLESPTEGRIQWAEAKPNLGFVFQDSELLGWRNVFENVILPLDLQKKNSSEQEQKALWALARVGLKNAASLFPHQLSGGMKMRVSIARALCASPQVLFMDEPFSALDEVTRFDLQDQLRELCEQEQLTVVFVTHSIYEAAFLADRVIVMSQKQGQFILEEPLCYHQARKNPLRTSPEYQKTLESIGHKMRESFL